MFINLEFQKKKKNFLYFYFLTPSSGSVPSVCVDLFSIIVHPMQTKIELIDHLI